MVDLGAAATFGMDQSSSQVGASFVCVFISYEVQGEKKKSHIKGACGVSGWVGESSEVCMGGLVWV